MDRHVARIAALFVLLSATGHSQIAMRPTQPPQVTAGSEAWYVSGEPISVDGIAYYPSGPVTHFSRNEMVQAGWVGEVPVYIRTTREPRSVVYIPLAGGLVRPYERRRDGDLAGTVGSTAPSFPVVLPTSDADRPVQPLRAPSPPTGSPVSAIGHVPGEPAGVWPQEIIATSGMVPQPEPSRPLAPLRTARRPEGLNAVFVEYAGARWLAAGHAVLFDAARFQHLGEYQGFTVYRDGARPDVIYVPVVDGAPGLVTPYRAHD